MLIIDNSCLSFAFNIGNGVPILPFYESQTDEEMKHLTYYLSCLVENIRSPSLNDVREYNDDAFGLLKLKDTFYSKSTESDEAKLNTHNSGVNSAHAASKDYLLCEPIEMNHNLSRNKNISMDVIEE